MSDAAGWTELTELWRQLPTPLPTPVELRRAVDRQTSRLRRIRWVEMGVVVLMAGWLARGVPLLPPTERPWWIIAAVLHSLAVVGFTAWNRRGIFEPLGESTRDYVRLARLRLARSLRTAGFVVGLLAVEAVVLVAATAGRGSIEQRLTVAALAAVVVVASFAGAVWYRRHARRELARLVLAAKRYGLDPGNI